MGDFCHNCGLDFKQAGGQPMPPQQPLPPSQPIYSSAPPQPAYNPAPPAPQSAGYYTQAPPPAGYYQPSQSAYPANPWAAPGSQSSPPAQPMTQTGDAVAVDAPFGGQPATANAAAQPVSAPSVCLRCYAPLHPGYALCGNCGFDNTSAWRAAPLARTNGVPMLAVALALLGAGLIVAAAVLLFVAQ
jgi:ribosomal protein L40E